MQRKSLFILPCLKYPGSDFNYNTFSLLLLGCANIFTQSIVEVVSFPRPLTPFPSPPSFLSTCNVLRFKYHNLANKYYKIQ